MTKYENAIICIKEIPTNSYIRANQKVKAINVLQELVERDTPKKPIIKKNDKFGVIFDCPNCGKKNSYAPMKFCYDCGQALDWSK